MNAQTKIEPATLHAAMAAAFAEIESATKSANNPHFKSKYADLTTVIEAIKPALAKHNLFFTQRPTPCERGIQIETVISHASGEDMSLGILFVPANKNDAQGYGSALTYARRYALVTAFGVPVEDDDGNAAASSQRAAQKADEGQSQQGAVSPPAMPDHAWAKLVQLVEATKSNTDAMCKHYNVKSLRDLSAEAYGAAVDALEKKLAKMVKAETAAKATKADGFGEVLADEIPY